MLVLAARASMVAGNASGVFKLGHEGCATVFVRDAGWQWWCLRSPPVQHQPNSLPFPAGISLKCAMAE